MNKLLDMIDKIYDIDNIVLRSFCKSCLCLLEIILALSIVGIITGSITLVLIIGEHLSLLSNIVLIIVLTLIVFTIMYCILDMLER